MVVVDFFRRVYDIVAQVPPGKVITYGQIASFIGQPRAARQVGWAMWDAPPELNLPCHRVVNQAGAMSPPHIFGGEGRQRATLEAEGVVFKANGCIDMARHKLKGLPDTKLHSIEQ